MSDPLKSLPEYRVLPPVNGLAWLRGASLLLAGARLTWLVFFVVYVVILGLLTTIPFIGTPLATILKPVFTVGFLAAAWSQARGGKPAMSDLFRGFQSNLRALIPLGLCYWAGINLAIGSTVLIDGGTFSSAVFLGSPLPENYFTLPESQWVLILSAAGALPVMLALWFAPALVVFDETPWHQAIRLSLAATVANWRPFIVLGATVFLFSAMLPAFLLQILVLIFGAAGLGFALVILMPWWMALMTTLSISDYVSYIDTFHPEAPMPETAPPSS